MHSTLFHVHSLTRSCTRFVTVVIRNQIKSASTMGSSNTKRQKSTLATSPSPSKCTAPCSTSASTLGDDYEESIVCQESDLGDNQMREFDLNGKGKILLVKQGGKLSAIGTKCSHYGAPLVSGALGDGRVRCPWHGACFNVNTGDIEDFPGLDSVPCYQVKVETDGGVRVRARRDLLASNKRVKTMSKRDPEDKSTFLVIGMGAAGACCVETLRQEGYRGRLVFVGREQFIPYDRIKLSKALDADVEKLQLRTPQFYKDNDIEVMVGTSITSLDPKKKTVTLSSGDEMQYNAIFLATGSQPRRGSIPGSDLTNVCVLRSVDQANFIASRLSPETNVVILGASFIGMEVATFCVGKAKSVTVLVRDNVPFKNVLGEEVGARIMELFKEKGVTFELQCGVASFVGDGGEVKETELNDGRKLPSDVVVLGIGSDLCTEYLKDSGIQLDKSGAVVVDQYLQGTEAGVFAGGDIAFAPVLGKTASIGHWQLAHYHGRMAALNMLGQKQPLKTIPYFWTVLFGKSIRYAGYAPGFDSVTVTGDLPQFKFVAYYCVGQQVAAIATANSDPIASKFAELIAQGRQLTKSEIEADPTAWTK